MIVMFEVCDETYSYSAILNQYVTYKSSNYS